MARRPDNEKPEVFTQRDLDELRRNLAHLSPDSVRKYYESAHDGCRLLYGPCAVAKANPDAGAGVAAVVEVAVETVLELVFFFYAIVLWD